MRLALSTMGDWDGQRRHLSHNMSGMAAEVRADPIELTRLAQTLLRASQRLGDAWRAAQRDLTPPVSEFGDTAGCSSLHKGNATVVEPAGLALDRLVAVLEGDVDRVYRLAFAYEQADLHAMDEMERGRGGHP
jgi:hypothetical protein